jgi:hypothetical protein
MQSSCCRARSCFRAQLLSRAAVFGALFLLLTVRTKVPFSSTLDPREIDTQKWNPLSCAGPISRSRSRCRCPAEKTNYKSINGVITRPFLMVNSIDKIKNVPMYVGMYHVLPHREDILQVH